MDIGPLRVNVEDPDTTMDLLGREVGPSDWLQVTQRRIDTFADAANDRHWVHIDPDMAARGPFGSSIAHAHLTLAF
jgi:acyl dehydratase